MSEMYLLLGKCEWSPVSFSVKNAGLPGVLEVILLVSAENAS